MKIKMNSKNTWITNVINFKFRFKTKTMCKSSSTIEFNSVEQSIKNK